MNQPLNKYDCGSVLVCMREFPLMQPQDNMWNYCCNYHAQSPMYFREVPTQGIASDYQAARERERADSNEYDYHTTVGEVIQADWEWYNETNKTWHTTSYPSDTITPGSARHRSKKKRAWVPKVGEWASFGGVLYRIVEIWQYDANPPWHHGGYWCKLHGLENRVNLRDIKRPTPEEIAIAERREKLPPIPDGWEWVKDRSEKPHPKAKVLQYGIWVERLSYNIDYEYSKNGEYIKPIRTEEATSGKDEFRVEREGVYRRRDGSIVSLRKYHESWKVCEYDTPRYVNAAGRWSGSIESPEDVIEYLAPLPPDGSKLLNKKVGEALPKDGILYCCPTRHTDTWIASNHLTAKRDCIYAHKPASEQPKPITHWTITTDQNGERE